MVRREREGKERMKGAKREEEGEEEKGERRDIVQEKLTTRVACGDGSSSPNCSFSFSVTVCPTLTCSSTLQYLCS